jgi:hypothetical protein
MTGRGRSQRSLVMIKEMYKIAEACQPITGRGIGYKLFPKFIDSMNECKAWRVQFLGSGSSMKLAGLNKCLLGMIQKNTCVFRLVTIDATSGSGSRNAFKYGVKKARFAAC